MILGGEVSTAEAHRWTESLPFSLHGSKPTPQTMEIFWWKASGGRCCLSTIDTWGDDVATKHSSPRNGRPITTAPLLICGAAKWHAWRERCSKAPAPTPHIKYNKIRNNERSLFQYDIFNYLFYNFLHCHGQQQRRNYVNK